MKTSLSYDTAIDMVTGYRYDDLGCLAQKQLPPIEYEHHIEHRFDQLGNRQGSQLSYYFNKSIKQYFYCLVFLILLIFSGIAVAGDTGPTSIVYKLYKDYGWVALFSNPDTPDAIKFLGKPITQQPKNILINYFDDELANLLVQDDECIKNNPGEVCKLGFDPIFASQDIAAYDLRITDAGNGKVNVEYSYPSNHKNIKLIFFVVKTKGEWKISDIDYGKGHFLKKILTNDKYNYK